MALFSRGLSTLLCRSHDPFESLMSLVYHVSIMILIWPMTEFLILVWQPTTLLVMAPVMNQLEMDIKHQCFSVAAVVARWQVKYVDLMFLLVGS